MPGRVLAIIPLLILIQQPVIAQSAARQDTMVLRAGAPQHAGIGRLVDDGLTIGQVDGPPEYTLANVLELKLGPRGSIYVLESPVRGTSSLREYDAKGKFVRSIGGVGSGPGEFRRAGGVTVASDGSIVLLDPNQNRVNIYGPGGKPVRTFGLKYDVTLGAWGNLSVNPGGIIALINKPILTPEQILQGADRRSIVRVRFNGTVLDTLVPPQVSGPAFGIAIKRSSRTTVGEQVPYLPRAAWFWSPLGYFVTGRTDQYAFNLLEPGKPVLRIVREDAVPTPVSEAERNDQRSMRQQHLDALPGVQFGNLAEVPRVKPFFNSIGFDADGRILVIVEGPSERFGPARSDGQAARGRQPIPWRQVLYVDLFETNGTYIGRFALPQGLKFSPTSVRGNRVWAVVRDEFDVEYVKRFRIEWPR